MKTKRPYEVVKPIADQIVHKLELACIRIEIAGSLRRYPQLGSRSGSHAAFVEASDEESEPNQGLEKGVAKMNEFSYSGLRKDFRETFPKAPLWHTFWYPFQLVFKWKFGVLWQPNLWYRRLLVHKKIKKYSKWFTIWFQLAKFGFSIDVTCSYSFKLQVLWFEIQICDFPF